MRKIVCLILFAALLSSCGAVQKTREKIFGPTIEDDCSSPNAVFGKETLVTRPNGSRVVVYETPREAKIMYLEIDAATSRTLLIFPIDDRDNIAPDEFPK